MLTRFIALSRFLLVGAFIWLIPTSIAHSEQGKDNAIIVFDASGSMWGQIGGRAKIEIARETLSRVLNGLPPDLQLGLIAYGHNRKGDCTDIQTLVRPGPAASTGQQISQSVRRIQPKGKTPLTDAVKEAAQLLRHTENKATVILVTDGIETCDADPCAIASELERSGIDFTTHVVGFGLSDEEGRQVACLAENTGGKYFQARNADELADALGETVAIAPPPPPVEPEPPKKSQPGKLAASLVLSEGGEPISKEMSNGIAWFIEPADGQGSGNARTNISRGHEAAWSGEAGDYLLTVEYRFGGKVTKEITIKDSEVVEEIIPLSAARLNGAGALVREDLNLSWSSLQWTVKKTGSDDGSDVGVGETDFLYGYSLDILVPAGEYEVIYGFRREKGSMNPPRSITAPVGETTQIDFILPYSQVSVNAIEQDGNRNTKIRQWFSLRNPDGSEGERIHYEASPKPVFLRPGQYVVAVELWDGSKREPVKMPIDVGAGQIHTFDVAIP
ncbi:MAG: VWA domain-containing protein [Pseudomonadota bacterium]